MSEAVFKELTRMGMKEGAALELLKLADPLNMATKQDIMTLQEGVLQVKLSTEGAIQAHREETHRELEVVRMQVKDHQVALDAGFNGFKEEMRSELKDHKVTIEASLRDFKADMRAEMKDLKVDIHSTINRQFILTFGGLFTTIATVVAVNWYFH